MPELSAWSQKPLTRLRVFEPYSSPATGLELGRLGLLDDPETLPAGRVEDPAVPQPEGDVVGPLRPIGREIAGLQVFHRRPGLLLLPRIPGDNFPRQAVRDVDKSRAVEPRGGEP